MKLFLIFMSAAVVNNFVLSYFLGICPLVGVSKKVSSAVDMGLAVTFVMVISASVTWLIYHLLLVPFHMEFLEYVSFILVIASLVQLVEMFIRKVSKPLYEGVPKKVERAFVENINDFPFPDDSPVAVAEAILNWCKQTFGKRTFEPFFGFTGIWKGDEKHVYDSLVRMWKK